MKDEKKEFEELLTAMGNNIIGSLNNKLNESLSMVKNHILNEVKSMTENALSNISNYADSKRKIADKTDKAQAKEDKVQE